MALDGSGCFPSYALLADESGLDRSTIIRHVKKAAEAGYLTIDERQRENGSATSNLYHPTMPGLVAQCDQGGGISSPADILLPEVFHRYCERHGKHVKSWDTIRWQLGLWNDFFGNVTVREGVTFERLEAFKEHLAGTSLSPVTINHTLAIGRAAMRQAHMRHDLAVVPAVKLLEVGDQEPKGRPLSVEECARVLAASEDHIRTLWLFLLGTAARPGAILDMA
jgi:hypothetical protein